MFHFSLPFSRLPNRPLSLAVLLALILPGPSLAIAATSTSSAAVSTGAAVASSTIATTVNTNVTNHASSSLATSTPTSRSTSSTTNSTSTPANAAAVNTSTSTTPIDLTVGTTNQATTTTAATTTATTGANSAGSVTGTTTITTGNAVAYTNVLNLVNTTVTDANGLIAFLNLILGGQDFNLTSDFQTIFGTSTAESTNPCLTGCTTTALTSTSSNTATLTNNVTVGATTGGNSASGTAADVTTGNAYAAANVVNVANTNLTDANYLLVVFNNFSNYNGDVVLPNSDFFTHYLAGSSSSVGTVHTTNQATITNAATTTATTGNNLAHSASSTVSTGSASAGSSIVNTVNQNFLGTNSFSMLIHVYGTWSGNVVGLPPGMSWQQTPEGIRIFATGSANATPRSDTSSSTNTATINNRVHVYALTGNNEVGGGTTNLTTGDAFAAASIYNLANTNIIGGNWASLIFNIFGNWNGNLSFGQPNVWLGMRATSPDNPIMPGSEISYTYTLYNRGNLPATNVVLDAAYQAGTLAFRTGVSSQHGTLGHTQWSIGTLAPGATRDVTYTARVTSAVPSNARSFLTQTGTVTETEHDANPSDNTDTIVLRTGVTAGAPSADRPSFPAKVAITTTASLRTAHPGDVVHYTIDAKNNGGPLYNAALVSTLRDHQGTIVANHLWPLDTFQMDDAVRITYDLQPTATMATGTYTNTTQVVGFDRSTLAAYQQAYSSPTATTTLLVTAGPVGQVLGASTTTLVCPPYLTSFLKRGDVNNNTEVTLLQEFLNATLGSHLTSDTFDAATEAAVKRFQNQYASSILAPWGITAPTGYVYLTTQKKINELQCNNTRTFPLTSAQQIIITRAQQSTAMPGATLTARPPTSLAPPTLPPPAPATAAAAIGPRQHPAGATVTIATLLPVGTTSSVTAAVRHLFARVAQWLPSWL